jgi:hypothetical protein
MNARIWGDLLPGRISNMNLHVKYLHDGIMEASKNGAEIFSAAPVINYNRISKRPEEILAIRKSAEIGCEGLGFTIVNHEFRLNILIIKNILGFLQIVI